MRRFPGTLLILLGAGAAGAAPARPAAPPAPPAGARPPAFATFRREKQKFSIAYPRGWEIVTVADDARVWFLPSSAGGAPPSPAGVLPRLTHAQPRPLS